MKPPSSLKEENSINFTDSFEEGVISFHVRKGYMIGKMSIFEGFFAGKGSIPAVISCKS